MFGPNHYLPILKGKAGEFGALRVLSNQAKRSLTPLIDVPRVTLEYPQRVPKQPLEKHLAKVAKNLLLSWGLNRVMFVDLSELELADRTSTGSHPMTCIFDWLRKNGEKRRCCSEADSTSNRQTTRTLEHLARPPGDSLGSIKLELPRFLSFKTPDAVILSIFRSRDRIAFYISTVLVKGNIFQHPTLSPETLFAETLFPDFMV